MLASHTARVAWAQREALLPKLAVTLIESIVGSVATTDGRHAVLQARTTDDTVVALGVAHEQLAQLIDHCAFAHAQCESVRRGGLDLKATASWWNGTVDQGSGEFTLTLTFGKGGALSFALTERMAKLLLATLRDHYEGSASGPLPEETCRPALLAR
jgi:hypothetical protein